VKSLLAFAASTRRESFNRRLLAEVAAGARDAGAEVQVIELADYPLPLFDQDLEAEQGLPENVVRLKQLMAGAAGFLIACPEYNGSMTPLFKNTFDWCSRRLGDEPAYASTRQRIVGLASASAGKLGGLRGLRHAREVLTQLQCVVLPEQFALSGADQAFDPQGRLTNPRDRQQAAAIGARVARVVEHWT
jgi:chromate reductase, NAD(P)H dehydrogenase (quinone)